MLSVNIFPVKFLNISPHQKLCYTVIQDNFGLIFWNYLKMQAWLVFSRKSCYIHDVLYVHAQILDGYVCVTSLSTVEWEFIASHSIMRTLLSGKIKTGNHFWIHMYTTCMYLVGQVFKYFF